MCGKNIRRVRLYLRVRSTARLTIEDGMKSEQKSMPKALNRPYPELCPRPITIQLCPLILPARQSPAQGHSQVPVECCL